MTRVAWAFTAALLAGCAVTPPSEFAQLPPAGTTFQEQAARIPPSITQGQARKIIAAARGRLFKVPDSVRNARISDPFTCFSGSGDCICIEANAKNALGGYAGVQLLGLRFAASSVEPIGPMDEGARSGACGRLVPFSELNGRR